MTWQPAWKRSTRICFAASPYGRRHRRTRDSRRDTWEHQNEHFVRDFLQFWHCVASKSMFSTSFPGLSCSSTCSFLIICLGHLCSSLWDGVHETRTKMQTIWPMVELPVFLQSCRLQKHLKVWSLICWMNCGLLERIFGIGTRWRCGCSFSFRWGLQACWNVVRSVWDSEPSSLKVGVIITHWPLTKALDSCVAEVSHGLEDFCSQLIGMASDRTNSNQPRKRRELASTHFSSAFACWVGCSCRCFDFGLFQLVMLVWVLVSRFA